VGETFFANLMEAAGACPDLVISITATSGTAKIPASLIMPGTTIGGGGLNANECTVDMTAADGIVLLGSPLAGINLAIPAQPTGLITTNGIYTYTKAAGTWATTPANGPTRAWTYAIVGDVNGDGLDDFAVMTAGPDVEVFRQTSPLLTLGSGLIPQWSDFVITTDDNVVTIAFGDFDGDSNRDVALGTSDSSSGVSPPPADLAIAWGNGAGQFAASQAFGTFDEPSALAAMPLANVSLPVGENICDSLLVAHGGATPSANDPALLTAEYGSTARALASPFSYFSTFGITPATVLGVGVAAASMELGSNNTPAVFAAFEPAAVGSSAMLQFGAVLLTWDSTTSTFQASPEAEIPAVACAAGSCFPYNSFETMRRDAGELLLALGLNIQLGATQCLGYYLAGSGAPTVQPISCANLAPTASTSTDSTQMQAFADLKTMNATFVIDNDGTTEHLLLSGGSGGDQVANTYVWELTVQTVNGVLEPQLANPIWLNNEITMAPGLLQSGDTVIGCFRGLGIELGTRTVSGVTYGANQQETVVACNIGPPAMGSGATATGGPSHSTVQLFARYAGPASQPPHYEMIFDTGKATALGALLRNDVNGDGLDDLLFLQGGTSTSARTLEAVLQCDSHGSEPGCPSTSGSAQ
jgi:hypothetical protein